MFKSITEQVLHYLGYFFFRLLYLSCRFQHINEQNEVIDSPKTLDGAYLLSAWHEHVIMVILSQKGVPFHPIVSRSSHGEFVGFICRKFGYSPLYGSQDRDGRDKGGTAALFGLLKALKKGKPVAITVDGSIGPRRYVKLGIIDLARKTQSPIFPVATHANRYWELNTWDKLKIPKPFARITIKYGNDFTIEKETKKEDFEKLQFKLGSQMNQLESDIISLNS